MEISLNSSISDSLLKLVFENECSIDEYIRELAASGYFIAKYLIYNNYNRH